MALNLGQTRFLQPLRSSSIHNTYQDAINYISSIKTSLSAAVHSDGISVVARYKDGEKIKSVLGIFANTTEGKDFTYFVHDSESIEKIIERVGKLELAVGTGGAVEDLISNAIKELDADTVGGAGKIVTSISETNGKISATAIDATASNIAVESDLFTAKDVEGVLAEIETALNKELEDRAAADLVLDGKIAAAKAAATTTIAEKATGFVKVSGTQNAETGAWTYTITENDIASAKALEDEISARTNADSALDGRLDVIEGEGAGSIKKAVADAKTELLGDAANDYNTLGKLEDKIQEVASAAKSYSIVAITEDLNVNVKEAFKLVDEDGKQAGATISIYKDSALQKVELVEQELQFTYLLANGTESTVGVDVSKFLAESEFKNGLQVVDHVVSVKIDAASESFLTVGEGGVKLSGVQDAINSAINGLDYTLTEEAGKAIVGVSQTDGKIAAKYGDIAASHVTVSKIEGVEATTVQDVLAELEGEIKTVSDAVISVAAGDGISVTGEGTKKTITAVANEKDSLIEVTKNGIGIKADGYIDCGTF